MIKKTIQYENLDGDTVQEDFYFSVSMHEALTQAAEGTLVEELQTATESEEGVKIMKAFTKILSIAVGERSENGKRLIKSPEIAEQFLNSTAFEVLLLELLEDAGYAAKFFTEIFPKDMAAKIQKMGGQPELPFNEVAAQGETVVQLPEQPARSPESYTHEEMVSMPTEQFHKLYGKDPRKWTQPVMQAAYMRKIGEK